MVDVHPHVYICHSYFKFPISDRMLYQRVGVPVRELIDNLCYHVKNQL